MIAESLSDAIQKMGGTVMTNREVTMLKNSKEKINSVLLDNDEEREAKIFISDIHPASTIDLLQNKELVRSSFRNRISRLENTYGIFTAHLELKENRLPYLNRNVHIHERDNVWSYHHYPDNGQKRYVFVSFAVPENGSPYATHIDLLSPMHWEELREWEHTTVGKRGQGYLDFKAKRADECIDIASRHIPRLRESIETVYTSTPLTWRDYTGTVEGSAYGIRKNFNELTYTILTPKTPVPNLFLTGQNLSVHGVLGVSMTSFLTCAEIIGADTILEDLKIKNMVKNHKLAKSISDVSWSEFIRELQYKAEWQHKIVQKIDTYYPSSQICSNCGYKFTGTKDLSVREWICPQCGVHHDRDENAAINILNEGLRELQIA